MSVSCTVSCGGEPEFGEALRRAADCLVSLARLTRGTPAEVEANQDPYVQQFIKGLPEGPVKFHYPARNLQEDFA